MIGSAGSNPARALKFYATSWDDVKSIRKALTIPHGRRGETRLWSATLNQKVHTSVVSSAASLKAAVIGTLVDDRCHQTQNEDPISLDRGSDWDRSATLRSPNKEARQLILVSGHGKVPSGYAVGVIGQ